MSKEIEPTPEELSKLVMRDVRDAVASLSEEERNEYLTAQQSVMGARRNTPGKEGMQIVYGSKPQSAEELGQWLIYVMDHPEVVFSPEEIAEHEAGVQSIIDARRLAMQNEGQLHIMSIGEF